MGIINTIKTTLNGINGATWINNVKIEGAQTISINNGKIYVNGNLREGLESPSIEVKKKVMQLVYVLIVGMSQLQGMFQLLIQLVVMYPVKTLKVEY